MASSGTYAMTIRQTAWDYLNRFATDQLALHSSQNIFDNNIFDRVYGDMERFFYSARIQFQSIIPLQNLTGDLAEIDLGQGLKIGRIMTSEIERLLDFDSLSCLIMKSFMSSMLQSWGIV